MGHEILKKLREQRGWTLKDLAERLDSYPQQISKYELGQTALTLDWIRRFADVFSVPPSTITDEPLDPTQRFADPASPRRFAAEHGQGAAASAYDMPVYGSISASDGRIDDLDAVTGLLGLHSLRGAFAVAVSGNSMEPRYRHGDYALIARGEWPQSHQDCLVETKDGEGYIKIYISHNDRKLVCEQLNPRQKWEMPMAQVKAVHLIKGRWK
jgi:phage repressor protein C with HTH and peptisase S24 domain